MHQAQTTTFHSKRFKECKTCKSCLESSVSKRFKAKWFKVVRMLAHIIMRRRICGRPHGGAGGDCSEVVESERLRHHFPSLCQEIQSQGFQCKLTQCDVLMFKKSDKACTLKNTCDLTGSAGTFSSSSLLVQGHGINTLHLRGRYKSIQL